MRSILRPEKDPLGMALLAYLGGDHEAETRVFPDFGEPDVLPASWMMREEALWPELERVAIAACRGTVLDIGAGGGSHSLALQQRGFPVTAIDISPGAVAVMRSRGIQEVLLTNIWEFEGKQYDTLLLMMNGIGIAGTISGLRQLLRHLHGLIAEGGQILLDSSDIAYMYKEAGESVPAWRSEAHYYGAVSFYMAYEQCVGDVFPWLYVHQQLLEQIAGEEGYDYSCLLEGDHFHYLARLSPKRK